MIFQQHIYFVLGDTIMEPHSDSTIVIGAKWKLDSLSAKKLKKEEVAKVYVLHNVWLQEQSCHLGRMRQLPRVADNGRQ